MSEGIDERRSRWDVARTLALYVAIALVYLAMWTLAPERMPR